MPPKRKVRSDKLSQDIIEAIHAALPALGQRGAALQELQVPALVIEANERHGLYFGDVGLRSSWARQGPSSENRPINERQLIHFFYI
jgi:hypothetical protein